MSSIAYTTVFEAFLGKVSDYDFVTISETDLNELLVEKLHAVLSQSYIRRLFSSLTLDDSASSITFTMDQSVDEGADTDFVVEILAKGIVVEWLKPLVRSKVNVAQMFGTKEQKFYSQSSHLSEIRALLEDTELELRKEIRDRGYISNGYLDAT